jgi:elongation factor 1-gamma
VWDFKYDEELTQTYVPSNQIDGVFNRPEASRKYMFGSVGVLGTAYNSIITGVFIARGQDIRSVLDVVPDWESYMYGRVDLSDAEQKAFFGLRLHGASKSGTRNGRTGRTYVGFLFTSFLISRALSPSIACSCLPST